MLLGPTSGGLFEKNQPFGSFVDKAQLSASLIALNDAPMILHSVDMAGSVVDDEVMKFGFSSTNTRHVCSPEV